MQFATSFLRAILDVAAESAPYLFLGIGAAALLRAFVPEQRVYGLLGRDSFRSVFLASAIGVPLPLCSCSVIPAATALRQRGASRAATTSFLISTPETGVDSIGITYALMDPVMTVIRPLAAFVTALVTGSAVGLLPADPAPAATAQPAPSSCCDDDACGEDSGTSTAPRGRALIEGLRYAFGPLLADLAPWLLVGFALAALLAVALPDGTLAAIPSGWISSLLAMLIATPVYICAAAATPVAAALILKGLDPGAALVFLLVGPATNVTTILVVSRFLGRRVLTVYLVGVTASALLFGAAVNAIYSVLSVAPTAVVSATEGGGLTSLQALATVALGLLLGYHLVRRVVSGSPTGGSDSNAAPVLR